MLVYGINSYVKFDEKIYPDRYCDHLCYRFSFWVIIVNWFLMGVCCLCMCIVVCFSCIFGKIIELICGGKSKNADRDLDGIE